MPEHKRATRDSQTLRYLDRYLGSPLLWLIGTLRKKRRFPDSFSTVGIMMFEAIGDTLLASTLSNTLLQTHPTVRIIAFASKGNLAAVQLIPGIHEIVVVPITNPVKAIRTVRIRAVDVMIDIGQWPRWYALLCSLAATRYSIGFFRKGQGRHWAYDVTVEHRDDSHEIENFQRLLTPFGIRNHAPPGLLERIDSTLKTGGNQTAIVHPWAGGFMPHMREWPEEHWRKLIDRMTTSGYRVLISGAPEDLKRSQSLRAGCIHIGQITTLAGECTLTELAALMKTVDFVVSVNTGIMHLAAIIGTPLVALHGPTSRKRWGPIGQNNISLVPPPPNPKEYLSLGFEYPRSFKPNLGSITIEEVASAVSQISRHAMQHPINRTDTKIKHIKTHKGVN